MQCQWVDLTRNLPYFLRECVCFTDDLGAMTLCRNAHSEEPSSTLKWPLCPQLRKPRRDRPAQPDSGRFPFPAPHSSRPHVIPTPNSRLPVPLCSVSVHTPSDLSVHRGDSCQCPGSLFTFPAVRNKHSGKALPKPQGPCLQWDTPGGTVSSALAGGTLQMGLRWLINWPENGVIVLHRPGGPDASTGARRGGRVGLSRGSGPRAGPADRAGPERGTVGTSRSRKATPADSQPASGRLSPATPGDGTLPYMTLNKLFNPYVPQFPYL